MNESVEAPESAAVPTAVSSWNRYQAWRRWVERGFWIFSYLIGALANSATVLMDVRRMRLDFAAWQPLLWETSSALTALALVPAVVAFTRRYSLHLDNWKRMLPVLALGSVAWSVLHVSGMVAIREWVYWSQGAVYHFGPWPREFGYEYLKDVRAYTSTVLVIEGYRLLLRRWQGEASLLQAPDEGPPLESIERPQRFLVRKLGREFLIAVADIDWMQASANYVNLRVRGHDYPLRTTMATLEEQLDGQRFTRVHRSYMVNLDRIDSIEPLDTGDARIRMRDGQQLPCSRRYRSALREQLA